MGPVNESSCLGPAGSPLFDHLPESTSGTLGHCYLALFLAIYHLGYIAPEKMLYSRSAISIFCYIATLLYGNAATKGAI